MSPQVRITIFVLPSLDEIFEGICWNCCIAGPIHSRGRLPGLQRDLREAAAGDGAGGGLGRALGPPPRGTLHVQVGGDAAHREGSFYKF